MFSTWPMRLLPESKTPLWRRSRCGGRGCWVNSSLVSFMGLSLLFGGKKGALLTACWTTTVRSGAIRPRRDGRFSATLRAEGGTHRPCVECIDRTGTVQKEGYVPKYVERLYEKSSNTSEPPRHEANHGSVHQRLAARTQPLVVFAHPPVLLDPSYRPLHHPPPREHHEALGGMNFSQSSFAPSLAPSLAHSLAHLIITSSGAGFLGRSTSSTLHPKVFSVPNPCPCLGHGSPRPITGDAGEEIARPPCAVGS